MIPVSAATPSRFTWSTLPRGKGYEIKLNGSIIGALRRTSFFSTKYEAITGDGVLRLQRKGWCGAKAEMVDSHSQLQVAFFQSSWRKPCKLTFTDGQQFYLQAKGFWRQRWDVTTEAGQQVLSLDLKQKTAEVAVGTALSARSVSLLIMFVLYRIRQVEEDSASIAATVAAIASS